MAPGLVGRRALTSCIAATGFAPVRKVSVVSEIAQVATISANGDEEVGRILAEAMEKVRNEGVITVEEAKSLATELESVEGMRCMHPPDRSPKMPVKEPPLTIVIASMFQTGSWTPAPNYDSFVKSLS